MIPLSVTNLSGLAACDGKQFVVARREDVVRVAAGGPFFVVSRQCDVDDGPQRLRVTDWGDLDDGICNPSMRNSCSPGVRHVNDLLMALRLPSVVTGSTSVIVTARGHPLKINCVHGGVESP